MEEMASLWSYQETIDEMRQKLAYTSLELEKMSEEMMKNKEYVKQLIQLLKMVCEERDELQKLVDSMKSTKANSSITDQSNSNNYYSSPELEYSNINSNPVEVDNVIESFVKGKSLPQQGKLLQSVVEAGPLLQTLLVSGQLPQWRNPPLPFKHLNYPASTSTINFANSYSASSLENHSFTPNMNTTFVKRQRLH
ncbi:uncharacterized protein LOC107002931 [Solanum pennellii]|uniref:Uncharacterized protein LOC107002931 n=1 Tax=Solanum pennellii TaxID=28526 RepID=A0ABM1FGQ9_SOLPN|nr:uncharacterized protein LOC107002931 [Solanum pennellii]